MVFLRSPSAYNINTAPHTMSSQYIYLTYSPIYFYKTHLFLLSEVYLRKRTIWSFIVFFSISQFFRRSDIFVCRCCCYWGGDGLGCFSFHPSLNLKNVKTNNFQNFTGNRAVTSTRITESIFAMFYGEKFHM